jgi:ABC-2 type transport system ATP-binding protein
MLEAVVEVRGLTKVFTPFFSPSITAVADFSCTIRTGEIVGLLGVNGAGKTTLLQMLLGTLLPTTGEVRYFGQDLATHRSEILERIGFAASYSNLPWSMKVVETLEFCSYLYTLPNRHQAVADVVAQFDLTELLEKRINQLSSGQLARVSLAKAFLNQPELLFLDEPTNYLDPQAIHMIHSYILQLQQKRKLTVLLASHNMQEVFDLCDRIILMHQGKMILTGKPGEIIARYFNHQVTFTQVSASAKNRAILAQSGVHGSFKNRQATVALAEKNIGTVIRQVTQAGLEYQNIVITKPSLEAVFTPEFINRHAHS